MVPHPGGAHVKLLKVVLGVGEGVADRVLVREEPGAGDTEKVFVTEPVRVGVVCAKGVR